MNIFEKELENYLGAGNLKKIQRVKIGVAGLGGLGSNCAFNLVRSGFCRFTLCDFDRVEYKNLNRQFYFNDQVGEFKTEALKANLLRINPDLDIELYNERLSGENINTVFSSCDAVVEAFDNEECKRMIYEHFFAAGKLMVFASGLAGWGNSDAIVSRRVKDGFYVVGDFASAVSAKLPPCSPRVNIAAAKQADIILDWVLKNK